MTVAENLSRVKEALANDSVTLVAVSKYVGLEDIQEAVACGITEFGENRVLDALNKQEQMPPDMARKINWHFIGHLQSNKVKKAVGRFSLIHSVDSFRLAEEISAECQKQKIVQPILLQVKVVEDPSKSGFTPDELKMQFASLLQLSGIKIDGLMTMTPLTADETIRRKCFIGLRQLREDLERQHSVSLKELSMGMSDDWVEAVKCGATIVRVGRAIFQK